MYALTFLLIIILIIFYFIIKNIKKKNFFSRGCKVVFKMLFILLNEKI